MKIVPIDSSGEPVEVLKAQWENGTWSLIIVCHSEQHNLTLERDKQLTIHAHASEDIEGEENMAELAKTPGKCLPMRQSQALVVYWHLSHRRNPVKGGCLVSSSPWYKSVFHMTRSVRGGNLGSQLVSDRVLGGDARLLGCAGLPTE